MPRTKSIPTPTVPADTARRFLLHGAGLLHDPARRAGPAAVQRAIEHLGFVQVDTINIVERAHEHILMSRFDGYRPRMLAKLLERDRRLFEHWTHDASIIPVLWFPHWKHRFERHRTGGHGPGTWWSKRMNGEPRKVIDHVLERIEREGPLMSRDFEHDGRNGPWWGWKPQKAALEYLWRTGALSISARVNFHKLYDLTARVLPDVHDLPPSEPEEHVDWACRTALERLGAATPGEIVRFWNAIGPADATRWRRATAARGETVEVLIESADGSRPRKGLALADWERRARRLPAAPARLRLLSPFDPVVRDRTRLQKLFGFDYRFEAFVPAAKRRYGYYVLPVLEGDRFVARVDPKHHRDRGELEIRRVWWEPRIRPTKARQRTLTAAIELFAQQIGAERVALPDLHGR